MEPNINVNDLIITKNCKESQIAVGDVVSFKRGDNVITHRIDRISNEGGKIYYLTKGDNNYMLDEEKITYNDIEGKLAFKVNKIGKVAMLLKNEKIVIAIIVILFIVNYYNCKRNKEKIRRQEQRRKFEKNLETDKL